MKKFISILFLSLIFVCSCVPTQDNQESNINAYEALTKNEYARKQIVECENKSIALTIQKYNLIKPNVDTIIVKKLVITSGGEAECKGYLETEWHLKDEYFSETKKDYFVEVTNMTIHKNNYVVWQSHWPDQHPFINY